MATPTIQRILVTGATGNQGRGVVRSCLSASHIVYALVRDPSTPSALKMKTAGATLVQGDLSDAASLKNAFQEAKPTALFLNLPAAEREQQAALARNVIAAAQAAPSVTTVVYSSAVNTGRHETFPGWSPQHKAYDFWMGKHEIEELVRGAKFERWTIVRLGFFLQNFQSPVAGFMFPEMHTGEGAASGAPLLRSAFKPDTKIDFVDAGDVGAVVAAALSRPAEFAGKEVDLANETLIMGRAGRKDGEGFREGRQGSV
jgi:uncharacterized protein YbjT (DUF2867 family)